MKIVTPSVEIMRTGLESDFMTPEQFIEKVGRTCYKSEDKITEDSAAKFVGNLIKRGHEAMIEHWSLVVRPFPNWYITLFSDWVDLIQRGALRPYLRFTDMVINDERRCIISGNMRAWRDFIKTCICVYGTVPQYMWGMIREYPIFFSEYQEYVRAEKVNNVLHPITISDLAEAERNVHQDITIKFICDRGVSHEMVRHRVASFAQESTRYCNYGLDKFGSEITVVRPSWCEPSSWEYFCWSEACKENEQKYFELLERYGCTPQQARSVLPNSLKTEIIVTMNRDGWKHFFGLRDNPAAQPDMREVAAMAHCMYNSHVIGTGREAE